MAFSFHLFWDLAIPAREASVMLEVLEPPSVDRLYFWAMQASFVDRSTSLGAGHLGLQWNPRYPGRKAVNWGGYDSPGAVLSGSKSPLPSTPGDPNTRDFPWRPGVRYRLRIFPSPETGWRGEVTDVDTGIATVVRDLHIGGDHLERVMVWTELFCECSDPRSVAAWSEPVVLSTDGKSISPKAIRVNYQSDGCTNTNVVSDGYRVLQMTAAERTTPQGSLLPV